MSSSPTLGIEHKEQEGKERKKEKKKEAKLNYVFSQEEVEGKITQNE